MSETMVRGQVLSAPVEHYNPVVIPQVRIGDTILVHRRHGATMPGIVTMAPKPGANIQGTLSVTVFFPSGPPQALEDIPYEGPGADATAYRGRSLTRAAYYWSLRPQG